MSLTELSEATSQSPSTVYRVLSTYEKHAVVEFQPEQQIWLIGREAFRIGSAFQGRSELAEHARAEMRDLMTETGETANLAIAADGEVMFISQVESHQPVRAFFRPGTRGPIHASGIGKALLAYRSTEQVDQILHKNGLPAFTPKTITERAGLMREMIATRSRGWAIDAEERTDGMCCIAAPIFNEHKEAIAGVSISGPSVRIPRERWSEIGSMVRQAADRVTWAIGGAAP